MTTAPLPDAIGARYGRNDLKVGLRAQLTVEDVLDVARGRRGVALDSSADFETEIAAARATVEQELQAQRAVYGVSTGVGASVTNDIPSALREEMPHNLFRFHGCGTGAILGEDVAAAIVLIRLVSLARAKSGVRIELLERLCELLDHRLLPRIPCEGSVGASGDLTPLSYLAAALAGEREVTLRGDIVDAETAHRSCGLEPLRLQPKESLALMNGTSVMTALACLAHARSFRVARLAAAVTAAMVDATNGNPEHYDDRILSAKAHPGQVRCGAWIRADLRKDHTEAPARLQDRYSLRCAPHVIGSLLDSLDFGRNVLETEVNGVDDNPIVSDGTVLHGGNFYGGHVAMVADLLKTQVAGIADLLDRQVVLVCAPETSNGLAANLIAAEDRVVHHGFKAMQISASALTAEALKLTMPASVFSRSTESHNQDKVSMGTIAARDWHRVVELTETVAVIATLAAMQAVDLRGVDRCGDGTKALHSAIRSVVPMVIDDRRQDCDIDVVLAMLRDDRLPLGAPA